MQVRGCSAEIASHGTLYVKDVTEVLQRKVAFCGKEHIMYRQEHRNALPRDLSPCILIDNVQACYKVVKKT